MGWLGPDKVAATTLRHLGAFDAAGLIVDAGCGTGMAGMALRNAGWTGRLLRLDLSEGMLHRASTTGVYDDFIKCSLYNFTLADGHAAAIVSTGVVTHGHVGGAAFGELCRITATDGIVVATQRLDLADEFESHIDQLRRAGEWEEIERSAPEQFHPERDDAEQVVLAWRVRRRAVRSVG